MIRWKAHRGKIASLSFSRDGRCLASVTGSGRDIFIWDATAGALTRKLTVEDVEGEPEHIDVQAAHFSPDQPLLAAVRRSYVEIWDTSVWTRLAEGRLDPRRGLAFELAVGPGSCPLIATGEASYLEVWRAELDTTPAKLTKAIDWRVENVPDIAFSADGRRIATHTTIEVKIRDPATGKEVVEYKHKRSNYTGPLCFSPDSSRLAYCSTKVIEAFRSDQPDSADVIRYAGHTDKVWVLRYTPDGRTLISASSDGTVRLWEASTGLETRCFDMRIGKIAAADVSPDGAIAAVGGANGEIVVWDLE